MTAATPALLRWTALDRPAVQSVQATSLPDGLRFEGVLAGPDTKARFLLETDAAWSARRLEVTTERTSLSLKADAPGTWRDQDGQRLPGFDGCIDPDLSASPLTNSLPIRRLGLKLAESAEIRALYVRFPDLTLSVDPQRYTRLAERRWLYESLDSDFRREIEVDADGYVTEYPGLFRRL